MSEVLSRPPTGSPQYNPETTQPPVKVQTLARGPKGQFTKKGAPGSKPEALARDAKGRFLPKSALGQFSEQLATTNKGRTVSDQGGFQLSDLPKMKMGALDPVVMVAALRYNTKTTQELVHSMNEQNEVGQRTYTELVGSNKKITAGQEQLSQLFDLDLDTNHASGISLDAIKNEMKENSKYTRVSSEFLARIVESLEHDDAQSKAKPFSRALVKSGTASLPGDEGESGGGGHEGHGGGGPGLVDLIGLLFGWKIAKKVFKGLRNMKPTTATAADDVAKMIHPERRGSISNAEEIFTQNSTPNDQVKIGNPPQQTAPDEPFNGPKGFNIQKPKNLPNITELLKNLGKSVIVKTLIQGVAKYAGTAAGLIAGRVLGVVGGVFGNSKPTSTQDQENAIMGRKPGTGTLGASQKSPEVTKLPEVTVTAKRTHEEDPYSSNRGGSPFIKQSSPYSYAPQGTATSSASVGSSVPAGGSVTAMPSVPGGKGDVSPNEAMSFFQSPEGGGWTKEQAAGIVANLQHESGLRGSAMGDGGLAYGMGQWHPDRQANFARVFGHPMQQGTPQEQLAFVNWELHNTEKAAGDALSQTKTGQDAGGVVSSRYERPANTQGEAMARGQTAAGLVGQTNASTASLQGSPQSSSGQAVSQASETKDCLQDAAKTPVVQPIVNAPTTTVSGGDQNKTAGPMPAVRNDDPTLLQAMRQDIKFS